LKKFLLKKNHIIYKYFKWDLGWDLGFGTGWDWDLGLIWDWNGYGIWDLGWDGMGWDGMGWDFEWGTSINSTF
jgi:hypothetical protein